MEGRDQLVSQLHRLGVDHSANTTIHLAEFLAGVPYGIPKYYTVLDNGVAVRVDYEETDHCCKNFNVVGEWLGRGAWSVGEGLEMPLN